MGENFIIIAQQVLVLFILIAVGFICGKKKIITDFSARHMTDIVLYVVTPCVMISAFQRNVWIVTHSIRWTYGCVVWLRWESLF